MSPKRKRLSLAQVPAAVGQGLDERLGAATPLRRALNSPKISAISRSAARSSIRNAISAS